MILPGGLRERLLSLEMLYREEKIWDDYSCDNCIFINPRFMIFGLLVVLLHVVSLWGDTCLFNGAVEFIGRCRINEVTNTFSFQTVLYSVIDTSLSLLSLSVTMC